MSLSTVLRTGKNATMLLAGTMTRMVASFVFVIYCADKLGVEGFGKYSIAIHYFELFLSLTAAAVGILLTRDIARWPRHIHQLLTSATLLTWGVCVFAPAIIWGIGGVFDYSGDTREALLVASVALMPAATCTVFEAVFVARERAELMTAGIAFESLLRISLSVWLLYQGYGLVSLLWCVFFVRCVLLVAYLIGLKYIGALGWSFHRRRSLRFVRRWRVFAAENWMATIYTSLDVIVLSAISGEVAVGIYSAAWKIVRLGSVVAKSYTTAVFPVISRLYVESRASFSRLYRHTIRMMCCFALPVIAVVTVIPERVIRLLFTEAYADSASVLRVLIWVLLIEFLNPFLSHVLFAQGRQDRSMRVAAISLAVNLFGTYLLVLRYGAVGAALGTVLGGSVATCCYLLFAMPKREIISTLLSAMRVVVAALGLGLVMFCVRDSNWLQLLLIGVAVYAALLFIVGAIRVKDLHVFRTTFLGRATG